MLACLPPPPSPLQYAAAEAKNDLASMISLQTAIKFNGGGHVNHSIFWTNLCSPKDFTPPSGELEKSIKVGKKKKPM